MKRAAMGLWLGREDLHDNWFFGTVRARTLSPRVAGCPGAQDFGPPSGRGQRAGAISLADDTLKLFYFVLFTRASRSGCGVIRLASCRERTIELGSTVVGRWG